jgi:hypothetical protein
VKVGRRTITASGLRCHTDEVAFQKGRKATSSARRRQKGFSLTQEQDERLLTFQGGLCWFCRNATGARKALAVDHDHKHCPGPTSCGVCVRGRLCGPCNQMLGRFGDDPGAFLRMALYAMVPVAHYALARVQDEQGVWGWAWTPEQYHELVQGFIDAVMSTKPSWQAQIIGPEHDLKESA